MTPHRDSATFARPAFLPGVELVSVAYRDRSFPVHSHGEYVVGVVESGAEMLEVGGTRHIVATGDLLRLHPGEPHANQTIGDDTLRYRVFYLPHAAILPWCDTRAPAFASPTLRDPAAAATLVSAHRLLGDSPGHLESESAMMGLVRALFTPHDDGSSYAHRDGGASIRRARAYIDAHYADSFGLSTLATVADLSPFHLVRSFKKATGLSPLAYRNQRRVVAARGLLLSGERIADVAAQVGFADQSHLTRQFQRIVGVSPGRYIEQ